MKPDIFSKYGNTQILAVQCHILHCFFCRSAESVIVLQVNNNNIAAMPQSAKTSSVMYKQQVIVKPPAPKQMRNKSILCKPYMHTKGVSCRPHPCTKETQTGDKSSILSVLQPYTGCPRRNVKYFGRDVKLYRCNPKHLYPKLNGYGDNGQRSLKL